MIATETTPTAKICADLQDQQRQRSVILKSRNMQANRLQAIVAGTLGYSSGMDEKERLKKFTEASALIKEVVAGTKRVPMAPVIRTTHIGIEAFETLKDDLEKQMVKLVKKLPSAAWVSEPEQRGFGLLFLAIVVGECGDLCGYANPGKLWRRLGCAPWTFGGKTAMGATWRAGKEGKLPADEWSQFGYSPRRRSIAFLIGEGIVKQNGSGPYRARYDATKVMALEKHADWKPLRCHRHAMLLATKMLLKQLWIDWRRRAGDLPADAWQG
jgi:hypothetical protein